MEKYEFNSRSFVLLKNEEINPESTANSDESENKKISIDEFINNIDSIKTKVKTLYIEFDTDFESLDCFLSILNKLENLEKLFIKVEIFNGNGVFLSNSSKLKKLRIDCYEFYCSYNTFDELTQLENLILNNYHLNEHSRINFDNLINLKILKFNCYKFKQSENMFDKLMNLEKLIIQFCEFDHLANLDKLVNLKYLGICGDGLDFSTESLNKLKNLETLKIISHELANLHNLDGLVNLKNLKIEYHRLKFPTHSFSLEYFKSMNNLKKLKIICRKFAHEFNHLFKNLVNLENLNIICEKFYSRNLYVDDFPQNLKAFEIKCFDYYFKSDDNLSKLEMLKIDALTFKFTILTFSIK